MGASNTGQNRIFYKLRVEKETNIPLFCKQKKDSNGTWVVDETFNTISGFLKKIELDSYQWEGDTVETLKFIFDDDAGGSAFQMETGFNYLSRSILNTLMGADSIGHVKIRVYTSKAKDTNSKVYPAAYLEINKAKAGWAYKADEVPKAKEVRVGGKTLKDDSELNDFFRALIDPINAKIATEEEIHSEMKQENGAQQKKGYTSELAPDSPEISDDLPF